jgi:hypothetical protein
MDFVDGCLEARLEKVHGYLRHSGIAVSSLRPLNGVQEKTKYRKRLFTCKSCRVIQRTPSTPVEEVHP